MGLGYRLQLQSCGLAAVKRERSHDCPFRRTGRKYPFPPRPPVEPDKQKTPRQIMGNAGVSFGLVCRRWPSGPGSDAISRFFPGKPGSCKTSGGFSAIFGGFQGFKKPRKAAVFFESGGISRGNVQNTRNFTDSRIGRISRLAPITHRRRNWSCADWTMFLRFHLISRTRKNPRKAHERGWFSSRRREHGDRLYRTLESLSNNLDNKSLASEESILLPLLPMESITSRGLLSIQ